ncbi:hypothetical protein J7M28_06905 [bacterium]|nr:hypothetical protein [bacterium]
MKLNLRFRNLAKSTRIKALTIGIVLIGALGLVLGASDLLTELKSAIGRMILQRMFVESATDLHIVQGSRTVLFTTWQELHGVRIEENGGLKEFAIKMFGKPMFMPMLFPKSYIGGSKAGVPMLMHTHTDRPSSGHEGRYAMPEDVWLWWFDITTNELRPLLEGDGNLVFPFAFNLLNGQFPIYRWYTPETYADGITTIPILVSVDNSSWTEIPSFWKSPEIGRGMIQLGEGSYVTLEIDNSGESLYLSHDGVEVISYVTELIGVTPNTRWVFFTRASGIDESRSQSLWVYDVELREPGMILEKFAGEEFRVTQDSKSFGFLVTHPYDDSRFWGGWHHARKIVAVYLYDLEGHLLEHIDLENADRGAILGSMYDWDPSTRIIAYHHPPHIFVRSLNGDLIGKIEVEDEKESERMDRIIESKRKQLDGS